MLRKVSLQTRLLRTLKPRSHPAKFSTAYSDLIEGDFGDYDIILPEEPYTDDLSHIVPRSVPSSIARPPYALPGFSRVERDPPAERITLGSQEETRLRRAAKLARTVREYAGTLVKVCARIQSCVTYTTPDRKLRLV